MTRITKETRDKGGQGPPSNPSLSPFHFHFEERVAFVVVFVACSLLAREEMDYGSLTLGQQMHFFLWHVS